jgi:hypothetical protein
LPFPFMLTGRTENFIARGNPPVSRNSSAPGIATRNPPTTLRTTTTFGVHRIGRAARVTMTAARLRNRERCAGPMWCPSERWRSGWDGEFESPLLQRGVSNEPCGCRERRTRVGLRVRIRFAPAKSRANSGTVTLVLDAAPAESPRTNPRNRCLPSAELNFRIHSPPADSPSLSRSHFRASRTRAFPAGVRGSLDDGVSRDAAGFPLRANRRQCLCRAIFQYRSEADVMATVPGRSGRSQDLCRAQHR